MVKQGKEIIKEGAIITSVFLVKDGECKLELLKNPLEYIASFKKPNEPQKPQVDVELQSKRGYISKTLTTFVLGTLGPHEWIGNDFILNNSETYCYNATALTDMKLYEINKKDMVSMPVDFLALFKSDLILRHDWIKKRVSSEAKSISLILKKEHNTNIDENYRDAKKKYPLAQKEALLEFRKQFSTVEQLPEKKNSPTKLIPILWKKERADSIGNIIISP
jgi:hypothetical protein